MAHQDSAELGLIIPFFHLATSLTCDDMQLLGSGVTAMSTTQIEAMADSDFIDCAQTLGGYSTWDSNQLLSLLTVATRSGVRYIYVLFYC